MALKEIEGMLISRMEPGLQAKAPGFDPAIFDSLLALLANLLSGGCMGGDVTPEQAVARVSRMSRTEQFVIQSRLLRQARDDGVRDAKKLVPVAMTVIKTVAADTTEDERIELAKNLIPISGESFNIF